MEISNTKLRKLCGFNNVDYKSVEKILGNDDDGYLRVVIENKVYRLKYPDIQYAVKKKRIVGDYKEEDVKMENEKEEEKPLKEQPIESKKEDEKSTISSNDEDYDDTLIKNVDITDNDILNDKEDEKIEDDDKEDE